MKVEEWERSVWSKEPYQRLVPSSGIDKTGLNCGSSKEPWSSVWCSTLSAVMGKFFAEHVRVLDYGCGRARYFNFLTGWLRDFSYFGVEPYTRFREDADRRFGEDERFSISELLPSLLFDVVVVGSVFSHLPFNRVAEILDRLLSCCAGILVFSAVVGRREVLGNSPHYGSNDCYSFSILREESFTDYFRRRKLDVSVVDDFQHSVPRGATDHLIFRCDLWPTSCLTRS